MTQWILQRTFNKNAIKDGAHWEAKNGSLKEYKMAEKNLGQVIIS